MSVIRKLVVLGGASALMLVHGFAAPPLRPLSGKGAGATTLVVYTDTRTAFSLGDLLALLQMQLQRVATRVETSAVSEATPAMLAAADYLVVFCPQSSPALATNFLQAIAAATQPVLWVGFGVDQLESFPLFKGEFKFSSLPAGHPATIVTYREQTWSVPVYLWIEGSLSSNSTSKIVISAAASATDLASPRPLCWQTSNVTFFAAVPLGGAQNFLFSDLLLDFYGVKETPPSGIFLRIEDYHCGSNHRDFQRLADYLYSRGVTFGVAVTPTCRDPETGQLEDLDSQPDYLRALRYAQQRGGRLIMHGCGHEPGRSEFWNIERDRPQAPDTPEVTRERLHKAARQMITHELFPLAWETPHYAASRQTYREIASVFGTGVERVQLSDSTCVEKATFSALTLDTYGRLILPENLGYALNTDSNAFDGIKVAAGMLTQLRGTVAGCYIHAYQPLTKFAELIDTLEQLHVPFVDLADLDNVVQVPGYLLLSGNAQRTVRLRNAAVRSKTFDRAGKLLGQEEEKGRVSGARTFKRISGDYQLIEIIEEN
jgi:uncharacterized protein YdaL